MKTRSVFLITALCFLFAGCSNDLESGKAYPALELGDTTLVFKIDKVMQNDVDVKPYLAFFDNVRLTLGYKGGKPDKLTFTEAGAPFRVTSLNYTETYETTWEINTAKSPYEIRDKVTGVLICYMTRDRLITFPFTLGSKQNRYEYQLRPVIK